MELLLNRLQRQSTVVSVHSLHQQSLDRVAKPGQCSDVSTLVEFDISQSHISQELGTSLGTDQKRVCRAKQKVFFQSVSLLTLAVVDLVPMSRIVKSSSSFKTVTFYFTITVKR